MTHQTFFATAPKGIEPLLATELESMGCARASVSRGGVSFEGTLATAYRACLWSRTASRILLPLVRFDAATPEALYRGVRAIPWEAHLAPEGSLAVDFTTTGSQISHSRFGAQKTKDAIVDRFRERTGQRPSVERQRPDLRIYVYLLNDTVTLGVDLSGDSLHLRGYRRETVLAPLKENLAAALLIKADWPTVASSGGAFIDPMCGSGTLAIEAALIAADIAPGLLREYWGFLGWRQHDAEIWKTLLSEARERRRKGLCRRLAIEGYDRDASAVRAARVNAARAGLEGLVRFEQRQLAQLAPASGTPTGLLLTNPPYGERLGEFEELEGLYATLGKQLKTRFLHWQAAVLTGNPNLGKRMGLRAHQVNVFYNGALPCKLLRFTIEPQWFVDREAADARRRSELLAAGKMFANRLRKNLRILGRWAKRENIGCYRLYDADIPEYAVAVDLYEDWLQVQEYAAPKSIDPHQAEARLDQVMAVLAEVLDIPQQRILLKVRKRQKGPEQYHKQADSGNFIEVAEGPCRFLVNLRDYLDTGLFLDHRPIRRMLGEQARGRRFLNLFAYTGTATVYAALGGATSTTTVDMSRTYLDWARRNLALNRIGGPRHALIQADCLEWLERDDGLYDLIFLDPPTFSNSKRMDESFDVQRDHGKLIQATLDRLASGGTLIFSNNYRGFRLDRRTLAGLSIEDITQRTIPPDFQRNPKIHNCWKITP